MIVDVLMVVVQDERSFNPEILQPHTILVWFLFCMSVCLCVYVSWLVMVMMEAQDGI